MDRTVPGARWRVVELLGAFGAIAIGTLAVVSGEADDSPGLQGLGCILVIATVVLLVRKHRRPRRSLR
jgi:hypothetical protein